MGSAVHSLLPAGATFTILEFKIDFVRPVATRTGHVQAEGRIVNLGKTIGLAAGELRDAGNRLLARGTTTCLIRRG
jgi:uncharacterized protein (TIGR00369 family)